MFDLIINGQGSDDISGAGPRMGIGYIVDAATLSDPPGTHRDSSTVAQTWEGDDIDPTTIQRLACDADLYAVLFDKLGTPTAVGRTRRSATREQRLQLRALYETCAIDRSIPFGRCEIHHVNIYFDDGGDTELTNLLPVSLPWHHRIHDRGWTLKMSPDRELKLWRPDGTLERIIPPPTPLTRQHE